MKLINNICTWLFVILVAFAPAAFAQETDPIVLAVQSAADSFEDKFLIVLGAIAAATLLMAGAVMTFKWAKATFFS